MIKSIKFVAILAKGVTLQCVESTLCECLFYLVRFSFLVVGRVLMISKNFCKLL